jgi:hypothetical protein
MVLESVQDTLFNSSLPIPTTGFLRSPVSSFLRMDRSIRWAGKLIQFFFVAA